jgi:elongation factor G
VLPIPWNGCKLNVIDTPGYADFRGEVISGLRVADSAVLVISAPAGVEVGTRQMWKMANEKSLPRMIFVSKMDRENADFDRVMASITEAFGRQCVPVQLPIGSESSFSGVINLLDPKAEAPAELAAMAAEARERLVEAVAEADDDLATKYLEGEEITESEIVSGLKQGIAAGTFVPVLFGSSTADIGVKELMNTVVSNLPSPEEVPPQKGRIETSGDEVSVEANNSGPLAALVFKTAADPFVGKISFIRVYSGTFKSDSQAWNSNAKEPERIGQVYEICGKEQSSIASLSAGDIGAVTKLNSALTGHTLSNRDQPVVLEGLSFPQPVYHMAVFPRTKSDVEKMTSSLTRIAEEDPSLVTARQPETGEMLIGGLGDTHIDVAVEKMKRKFGVELVLDVPKVAYKETIGSATRIEYKHKKQSGGHGQYGHVWLELQPLPRGTGFEFSDSVVGGSVPREYIPSVQKGVAKALDDGAIAGFPIVDLRATLVDGSFHPVDSSGVCFEIAGSSALKLGVQKATPTLLEPIMRVAISVPDQYAGDIIGDLNSKRGRIQGMTPQGDGTTVVESEVPQAEMLRYATELRSMTQGQGSFTMEYNHYEDVPAHMVQRVIDAAREREEARA